MPVPGIDIDALRIGAAGHELRELSRASRSPAETIGLNWKALRGPYQAHETDTLLGVADRVFVPPVTETTQAVDLVATALEDFAQSVRPLVEQLRGLAVAPPTPDTETQIQALAQMLAMRETECADAIRSAIGPPSSGVNLSWRDVGDIVGGGLLVGLSAVGEVGGAGLDATGVGLPEGLALGAASTAGIIYGRRVLLTAVERVLSRRGLAAAERAAAERAAAERAAIARGGAAPVRAGQVGEAAVRATYDIGPKRIMYEGGRKRIVDGLTPEAVSEVKNVARQSFTQQLKDDIAFAQRSVPPRRVDLYVNENTKLTKTLEKAIFEDHLINLRTIP
jgi:hypothetical protein